ncbi:MAG: molecular chaperone GroEL [Alphaproteobacteria bacterium]
MAKRLLHDAEARRALARGVAQLTKAVESTLGPKGMNAMIDLPVGTPIVSRDGVSIAAEIELPDRFENMGAQVVREVSYQTNEVAGDGTTTATVLANALIQGGVQALENGANAVNLTKGINQAVAVIVDALKASATPVANGALTSVASRAAGDAGIGQMVAEAIERVGADGIITSDFGVTVENSLSVIEGMSFDRGYVSHHMVTDVEKMEAVLERPYILLTDLKIKQPSELENIRKAVRDTGRPLLIVAEEISPEVLMTLLSEDGKGRILVVHPPEYGHWRKAMMEDLGILTGGRVIARDLGGRLENVMLDDLGQCEQVKTGGSETIITRGAGDPDAISARRAQVTRMYHEAPPNIEQDKLKERLAKLTGGTAVIYAGGVTPVEQKRRIQLIDDALNAARAAAEEGVVPGGGTALAQSAPALQQLLGQVNGDIGAGVQLVQSVLTRPVACIAANAGHDPQAVVGRVVQSPAGTGFDATAEDYADMTSAGVIDPVRVTYTALQNAASVATLVLTTNTLVGDMSEASDPTAGPALGGGAEYLGRE